MGFPKLSNIKTNSPVFILSLSLCLVVLAANIFIPSSNWRKIFSIGNGKMFATAFQATTTGDWNGLDTWGTTHGLIPFNNPYGIEVSTSGDIYVADKENSRIVILNPDGTFSTTTNVSLGLNRPSDVAISSTTGEIYIVDHDNNRIVVLNPDLTASTTVDGTSLGLGTIYPEYIDFSPTMDVYFINSSGGLSDGVIKLNPDLSYATSTDSGVGLYFPHGIAVAASGTVYIADGGGHRVVAFNPDLTYVTEIASSSFPNLTGVAVSNTGDVYVEDSTNIRVFDSDLNLLSTTDIGTGMYGISIGTSGEIYLTDNSNLLVLVRNSDLTASTTYNGLTVPDSYVPIEGIDFPGLGDDATNTGSVTLTQDQSVHDFALATSGTLDLNGYTLNVGGNWMGIGGTLVTNGGTINLVSTGTQSILGSNTFENLTKYASTSQTLYFERLSTTTVTNNLALIGSSGNLLTIGATEGSGIPPFIDTVGYGTLSDPIGVTVDSSGNIYVADDGVNQVRQFNSSGAFVQNLDLTGSGGLSHPAFLAIDSNDNVYMVDWGKNKIYKFVNGAYSTSSAVGYNLTSGITVDSSGNIYVTVCCGTEAVLKLDSNFNLITLSTDANSIGYSFYWGGIKIHREGNTDYLYVADDNNNRIVKLLASDLSYVSSTEGPVEAPFNGPSDVAFDSSGNIYVTNQYDTHVIKMASDYSFIAQWDGSENGGTQFQGALQMAVDSSNIFSVVDEYNGQVQRFDVAAPVNVFDIILSPSGTSSFAYLSVSGSANRSTDAFSCLTGCVNGGNNTNWTFPTVTVTRHHRNPITRGENVSTSTDMLISTSTPNGNELSTSTLSKATSTASLIQSFTKNLRPGSLSDDVKFLQIFLNTHGFILVNKGAGSPNNETNFFGTLTRNALIKFQEANFDSILKPLNLTKGTGNFLDYTRARVNQILNP